jgi:hypothetical protein
MKTPFTGGCACGAIRYECTAEPLSMFKCHCKDCQRVGGGAFSAVVWMSAEAFRVTQGRIQHHYTESLAGGRHKRGFCAACGSRLTGGQSDEKPSPFLGIVAGSLDDPSWFREQMHIFTSDAQPWDHLDSTVPQFAQYAPES